MSELATWDSFYVIVGSAAGALIGLQFVVVTLIAERPELRVAEAGAAFVTPTIVHFGSVLLLSALLRVPWRSIVPAAALWALMGFSGVAYAVTVARRMRKQGVYQPEFEDWLFHVLLPSRLLPTRARLCSGLARRRCCCFSSAFTMLGTVSPITYLSARLIQNVKGAKR
jgi:hypothetical protein